jgi:predicted dehydrogenase
MSTIKLALIGAGQRGMLSYGPFALKYPNRCKFIAVAEPNEKRREQFSKMHKIHQNMQFTTWEQLIESKPDVDGFLICTQDRMHVQPAVAALKAGYHILLEKPMAENLNDCLLIAKTAKETNKLVQICHVLRYTGFWDTLHNFISEGNLGEITCYTHRENVSYFHYSHSYVRGNWRNSDLSSPMILAKSCHDLDLMYWLVGSKAKRISSIGDLNYYRKEKAPPDAALRCKDCPLKDKCKYSAYRIYSGLVFKELVANYDDMGALGRLARFSLKHPKIVKALSLIIPPLKISDLWTEWPTNTITEDLTREGILKAIEEGPYGRCVWHCDNNVVDNQLVNIEFENGTRANFAMHGFSLMEGRTIRIDGTKGVIIGDFLSKQKLRFEEHATSKVKLLYKQGFSLQGHGGGDFGLMNSFVSLMEKVKEGQVSDFAKTGKTNVFDSLESHLMAFAAEQARITGNVVDMAQFRRSLGIDFNY